MAAEIEALEVLGAGVKEAEDGEAVAPGTVYIAPGGSQTRCSLTNPR